MSRVRLLILAALAVLVAGCPVPPDYARWRESTPEQFELGPYIMLGEHGQAFIAIKVDSATAPTVQWWISGEDDLGPQVAAAGARSTAVVTVQARRYADLWVIPLDELPVGQRISYRVEAGDAQTPVRRFMVGSPPGRRFTFAVFGDTRTGHDVHRAVIEAMLQHPFDFVVHTGDMVERGGIKEQWRRFFQIERPLLVDRPIIPSVGNHDKSVRNYYERYFLHDFWADGRRYYVKDWGHLRMVAIDTMLEERAGSTQYEFIEAALAEGMRRNMLMMLFLHFPPYSSGRHGSTPGTQETVKELAYRYGVELVVAGHDHNYERTKSIDGTTYIVSGSAGAPIRPVNPRWFTAEARTEPHFVLVDVEPDRMMIRAINLEGQVFDTAVIPSNPPGALK
jgi:acid phosphatase type 7